MTQVSAVKVVQYDVSPAEAQVLARQAARLTKGETEPARIADAAAHLTGLLPKGVLDLLQEFRSGGMAHGVRFTNLPIPADSLPLTPVDSHVEVPEATALLFLLGSALGDIYGFNAQQGGELVNDISPSPSKIGMGNISSGSREPFPFHTEDTFHPCFPDYVMFLSLRNADRIPLQVSAPRPPVPAGMWDLLSQPRFAHKPSPSHAREDAKSARAPVLFGTEDSPSIRINFANLDRASLSEPEQSAVDALGGMLRSNAVDVPLDTADCIILDNMRTAHARRSFTARFDGSDRWLKRTIVCRDLRRCMALSRQSSARIFGAAYI
jgi:L-asparagine oxygenase